MNRTISIPSILTILTVLGLILLTGAVNGETLEDVVVTVTSGQSTSLTTSNAIDFGSLAPGENNTVTDAFGLTNSGNEASLVGATFSTNVSTLFGLTNTTYVIGGSNISMQGPGDLTPLDNTASDTAMGAGNNVAADETEDMWDIKLNVPAGTTSAQYTGTIELTFS